MKINSCLAVLVLLTTILVSNGLAIVNGQIEQNHAAVGVVADGEGNRDSAVLIDTYWVLTSAAFASVCSDPSFYVGLDYATPEAVHAVSGIFPHTIYDPDSGANNIALLRLANPVTGITTIPFTNNPLVLYPGRTIRFVGYGWASLVDGSNTLRRSCSSTVAELAMDTFLTFDANGGPYLGDTGGPALVELGGEPYVAGIISLVTDGSFEYTVSTRISSYVSFIEGVMAANPPLSAVGSELPTRQILVAAPNPFNPATEISFELANASLCRLAVFDPRGRKVADLPGGYLDSGRHAVHWHGRADDGRDVPSGVYFVVLRTGGTVKTIKVALAR